MLCEAGFSLSVCGVFTAFSVRSSGFFSVLKVRLSQLWKGQKLRTEALTSISVICAKKTKIRGGGTESVLTLSLTF